MSWDIKALVAEWEQFGNSTQSVKRHEMRSQFIQKEPESIIVCKKSSFNFLHRANGHLSNISIFAYKKAEDLLKEK